MFYPRIKQILKIIIPTLLFLYIIFKNDSKTENSVKSTDTESVIIDPDFQKLIHQFDNYIDSTIVKNKTLGAAVAIVHNNQIKYIRCFGLRNSKTKDSINEHTVFRLASVSKAVSGVLAGILVNNKTISLNDKIIDYLPDFKLKTESSTNTLTVEHILDHTTGLVPHAYDNLVEANVPFDEIIHKLNKVSLSAEPGKLYGYQNVTYSLIDTIAEIASKKPFNELISMYVFDPFNMEDASVGFSPFENNNNIAFPHAKRIGRFRQLKLNDRYYNTIPAAGVNASITDMANLIKGVLKKNYPNLTDTIFKPRIDTPLRRSYLRKWGHIDSKHYGLGWRIIGYRGNTIAYHGGYVKGYKTEIAICEDENFGIVYLSNSPDKTASGTVPKFLNEYFDKYKAEKIKEQQKLANKVVIKNE